LPGEVPGALDPGRAVADALDPGGDRRDVKRVDEHRCTARDLLAGSAGARHHGAATGHRLEHWEAEALVEGRIGEAACAPVESGELRVRDLAEQPHRAGHLDAPPAAGADHAP